jgi:hypothetical protein
MAIDRFATRFDLSRRGVFVPADLPDAAALWRSNSIYADQMQHKIYYRRTRSSSWEVPAVTPFMVANGARRHLLSE